MKAAMEEIPSNDKPAQVLQVQVTVAADMVLALHAGQGKKGAVKVKESEKRSLMR